jgi:hypothetical protein
MYMSIGLSKKTNTVLFLMQRKFKAEVNDTVFFDKKKVHSLMQKV